MHILICICTYLCMLISMHVTCTRKFKYYMYVHLHIMSICMCKHQCLYVMRFAFEFIRPEIEKVVLEGVLHYSFGALTFLFTEKFQVAETAWLSAYVDHLRFHSNAMYCISRYA
jgi:hypothetical protein